MRIAVDVGGTFTDVILLDEKTQELRLEKVETTPHNPASGVLQGFRKADATPGAIDYFVHGTTLGLNALLTRTAARVAILTTRGFRDVYELGRTARDPMYDLTYRKPRPLVPRYLAFEVTERLDYQGNVLTAFDEQEARAVAHKLREHGVEAVAVCFLHSYANPQHELAAQAVLQQECPGLFVTLSHQLSREYREYERTSTTVIDAGIKPIMRSYLEQLDGELRSGGFAGHFLLTRSGGGAMTVASAKEQPVHLVLSGPAGGVIGASALSSLVGAQNLITLDMGGTSLDASLIVNGHAQVDNDAAFEHFPISLPILDIKTIGAGGGSIGWIDEGRHLQMGPHSAGSVPGPACYAKGGQQPTFTDAALLAGYLDPANFLGGEIDLAPEPAHRALQEQLATPLGLSVPQVATGMLRMSEAKITGAIREISIERGFHPGDFALFAFGGGGGFVASGVARELGLPRVIIPPGPANFSALGMLMVDVVHDFSQTLVTDLHTADLAAIRAAYALLAQQGTRALEQDGFSPADQRLIRSAELRYHGQEHTVNITLPEHVITADDLSRMTTMFNESHRIQYGHSMDDPIELVTLRMRAVGLLPRPRLPKIASGTGSVEVARKGERPVYRPGPNQNEHQVNYAVYDRLKLRRADQIAGPALIEEPTSTTILHAGDVMTVGEYGELVLTIGELS